MRTLVVAPHPDDEVLGCGGTLLRRKADKGTLAWLLVTGMTEDGGWSRPRIAERDSEIEAVRAAIGFDEVFDLRLPPARLDEVPKADLVSMISKVFTAFEPAEILLPHRGDVHSDHRVCFEAVTACTKWFRYSSVRRVLSYEAPSETDFAPSRETAFVPNVFVDITGYLDRKLEIMSIYASEVGTFPFPRSLEAIRALANVRGAASGFKAAEAFELLRQRE